MINVKFKSAYPPPISWILIKVCAGITLVVFLLLLEHNPVKTQHFEGSLSPIEKMSAYMHLFHFNQLFDFRIVILFKVFFPLLLTNLARNCVWKSLIWLQWKVEPFRRKVCFDNVFWGYRRHSDGRWLWCCRSESHGGQQECSRLICTRYNRSQRKDLAAAGEKAGGRHLGT